MFSQYWESSSHFCSVKKVGADDALLVANSDAAGSVPEAVRVESW